MFLFKLNLKIAVNLHCKCSQLNYRQTTEFIFSNNVLISIKYLWKKNDNNTKQNNWKSFEIFFTLAIFRILLKIWSQ